MSWETEIMWSMQDESYYEFLKQKYKDRQQLVKEATDKRKASEKMPETDAHYHRMAIGAEMAQLRVDMAYMMDRNNQLEHMIGTVEFLHQRVGVLEGAYSHTKMLAENCRIDYALISKGLEAIKKHTKDAAK